MDNGYDIFISYRRLDENGNISGRDQARLIAKELSLKGYRVFFDYNEINDDDFKEVIIPAVRNSKAFILVLTKDALKRCKNEDDWIRKEIETALSSGTRIISVSPDNSFNGWPLDLPASLEKIKTIQISEIHFGQLFEESIEKLINYRIVSKIGHPKVNIDFSAEDGFDLGYEMSIFSIHKLRGETTTTEEDKMCRQMSQSGLSPDLLMRDLTANNMMEQLNECTLSLGRQYGKDVENAVSLGVLYAHSIIYKQNDTELPYGYQKGIMEACYGLGIAESIIGRIITSSGEEIEGMYDLLRTIIRNLPSTTQSCKVCGCHIANDYNECPVCHTRLRSGDIRVIDVRKQLTDLAYQYDALFEQSSDDSIPIEERQKAFMDSAKIIGNIVQLYRDTKSIFPSNIRSILDEKLNLCQKDKEDGLINLIVFVQAFNKEVDNLLGN